MTPILKLVQYGLWQYQFGVMCIPCTVPYWPLWIFWQIRKDKYQLHFAECKVNNVTLCHLPGTTSNLCNIANYLIKTCDFWPMLIVLLAEDCKWNWWSQLHNIMGNIKLKQLLFACFFLLGCLFVGLLGCLFVGLFVCWVVCLLSWLFVCSFVCILTCIGYLFWLWICSSI